MKRIGVLVLLFVSSTSVFAQATRPYLVATRHAGRIAVQEILGTDIPAHDQMNVKTFTSVDAFAADLTDAEVAALQHSPRVRFIEPDPERHAFAVASVEGRNPAVQTQPYGIGLVGAPPVWPVSKGANVNVAILDTGIDYTHPDLAAVYAGGRNTVVTPNTDDPKDDEGHGTHVAGTIAAADNSLGVIGVAPQAKIWSVKVLDSTGSGKGSFIIAGLEWVIAKKAALGGNWIISMSLGSCASSTLEQTAITKAINAGILVVAAAGNHNPAAPEGCDSTTSNSHVVAYPAAYPGVVAVAAVDSTSTIADFSNYGPEVSVSAPGVNVLSSLPVGKGANTFVTSGASLIDAAPVTGTPFGSVTGKVVDCGLGNPSEFPAAVSGNIALIKRGDITFNAKAKNAKAAGAAGVLIYNKDTSSLSFTMIGKLPDGKTDDPADLAFAWPVTIAVTLADGTALQQKAGSTVTIGNTPDDYGVESGTSMAAPHVSGVAALAWSVAPSATADAVKNAITSTAHDLGTAGVDDNYGHGLVDAYAAAKALNPAAFSTPAQPPTSPTPTGRRSLHRG